MWTWLILNYRTALPWLCVAALGGLAAVTQVRLSAAHLELANYKADYFKDLANARSTAAADQKAIDSAITAAAVADAEGQVRIVTRTTTLKEKVPVYVKDNSTCITVGLIRVLDAAALGVDPETLDLRSGESNESCADISAVTLAQSVNGNYGLCHANAEQLNNLAAAYEALRKQYP